MKYLTKENIIITLIIFVFIQGFFSVPSGVSEEEVLYRIKINELTNQKIDLIQKNNDLETKINTFKDERTKIDSIVSDYSTNQLDSFYTDFFR